METVTGGKRVYPRSGNQSQEGREYIPRVRTNHRREDRNITSFYRSTCASNGKGALNTPETLPREWYRSVCFEEYLTEVMLNK
eukprot:6501944-Pyramimonas_sp.AAC.1